ncbi:MAG: T9SS type A sorting domain-containing protein [Chitinophagales bacterium]
MLSHRLFIFIFIFILFSGAYDSAAQTLPEWHTTSAPISPGRYDDITFLNDHLGWAAGFSGILLKTTDAGNNWQTLNGPVGEFYRSICFLDSLNGFIGKLQTSVVSPGDTNFIYKTNDGGITWATVPDFPGPRPAGICGMFPVKDSVLYAVGRYSGPAGVYKTADKGNTWQYIDMSAYAAGLVDCYFWSADSGIVIGDRGNVNPWDSGGVILSTFDGGATWETRFQNTQSPGICWKISFPSRNTGYVSVQSFDGISNEYFLKTIDGGLTWMEKLYSTTTYNAEGIGFINDSVGWIGGSFSNSFATVDGGNTWIKDTIGIIQIPYALPSDGALNRFRFISDTLGFASGVAIYRYSKEGIVGGLAQLSLHEPKILEVFPNPSNSNINVSFMMKEAGSVKISIETYLGQMVFVNTGNFFEAGKQRLEINTANFENGIYFLILETDRSLGSSRFVLNR